MQQELQPVRRGQRVEISEIEGSGLETGAINNFSNTCVEVDIDFHITRKIFRYNSISKSWDSGSKHYKIVVVD